MDYWKIPRTRAVQGQPKYTLITCPSNIKWLFNDAVVDGFTPRHKGKHSHRPGSGGTYWVETSELLPGLAEPADMLRRSTQKKFSSSSQAQNPSWLKPTPTLSWESHSNLATQRQRSRCDGSRMGTASLTELIAVISGCLDARLSAAAWESKAVNCRSEEVTSAASAGSHADTQRSTTTDVTSGSTASPLIRPANPMVTPAASSPEPLSSLKAPGDAAASDATLVSHGEEKPPKTNSPSETDADHQAEAETETDTETEEEKARRLLYCSLCKVAVNSASQLDAHNTGTKHKTMLEARSGVGSIKSFPRPGVKSKLASSSTSSTGLQNKTFYCETCDVHVNSETQLKQIKLILGKEPQCRPLTAQILPAHLAAVAAAIGGSFTHRTNHGASPTPNPALFQTQALPAALLRPAPGPVRTSHPQVLFAPY
ncbi:hypothetical protein CCH79_00011468 [Gambusia affinis]|uniref:C2H2-type domain-containing protein n=1 Tax=Gambusia affinis TaxID=33528 RepID=A0A315VAX7_GAMAF|nr:hypothetical protein CCH79_00011468 [Gambusia affinis]